MDLFEISMDSPLGKLRLVAHDQALVAVCWPDDEISMFAKQKFAIKHNHPIFDLAQYQLNEYFNKKRQDFDIPLDFLGGTPFQQSVWNALKKIPFATTWSYSDVASYLNHPLAIRAIGGTIGKNPLSIIIPCHRVIGKNGKLTGFAGGLDRKKYLLEIENIRIDV
ncbi:methylated-DNA--[protein]-cysteine S-methyltransferase [Acinetobacter pollinis]|uniref:methylated-DNA--[protein]-cysteine S-methyltransferase n=1 Tax=Acinetobacter pollinis TaxID=2605270 RepID=UPI0018A2973C|nr:methylated-DNA--[protein]-cysteine S-methyltransferase [Acinetobacter pollinis]MBF7691061.1 methylated-DNA--[protein]-cysteine S-methyltransferase [Acinetobacter pollinis]MBF7698740.1 methylated-DNA--[protein]-cysteine S-methyltransferase [Acinetobacter pollinis]